MRLLFNSNWSVIVCILNNLWYWQDWISLSDPSIPGMPEVGCLRPFVVMLEKLYHFICHHCLQLTLKPHWIHMKQEQSMIQFCCQKVYMHVMKCQERFGLDPVVLCIWQNTVESNPKYSHLVMPVFAWRINSGALAFKWQQRHWCLQLRKGLEMPFIQSIDASEQDRHSYTTHNSAPSSTQILCLPPLLPFLTLLVVRFLSMT